MFDDRLEIESPGRFPDIVTADNITHTRFSRNKTISRVMTEFEWVREVNEGVKKIYADMAEAGLPAPEFIEMPNTVKLILRNNIDERLAYRNKASENDQLKPPNGQSAKLSGTLALKITEAIRENPKITIDELSEKTGIARRTMVRYMGVLQDENRIIRVGGKCYGHWQIND